MIEILIGKIQQPFLTQYLAASLLGMPAKPQQAENSGG
jgi:hypothetical protein